MRNNRLNKIDTLSHLKINKSLETSRIIVNYNIENNNFYNMNNKSFINYFCVKKIRDIILFVLVA